jgi:hypothetical protein
LILKSFWRIFITINLKIKKMSTIDNLFDGGRGRLGNLVFFQRHGKSYVRTRPARYKDRKSPAQLAQRQRLQVMNNFLKPFRNAIRVTFAAEAMGRSALQAAQSYNMRHAVAGEYPGIHIDKPKVLLSRGALPMPVDVRVELRSGELLISWENGEEAKGSAATDTLVVLAYLESAARADYRFTEARRYDGQYMWRTSLPLHEDDLPDVWIAFRNESMTGMSDSLYVERK